MRYKIAKCKSELYIYRKGGDSLAGRYLLFHLWPFTIAELSSGSRSVTDFLTDPLAITMGNSETLAATWAKLETMSGFPEPFLSGRPSSYRRWSNSYSQRLIHEDIRELGEVRTASNLETLYHLIPSKIGSPLSVPSLANDLKVAYNTVQNWLTLFERFYLTFSLPTWTERIARAIHKEREVDFLIANERAPFVLIECKLADEQPSKSLLAMQRALGIPAVQLVRSAPGFRTYSNGALPMLVAPAAQWCGALPT